MSDKYQSADLILKLYEMRREPVLREARSWIFFFNPTSAQDIVQTLMGGHGAHYRMVTTYWDMAAALVNHGAIDEAMFADANGEHLMVYSKIEPYLAELREIFHSPHTLKNLEELVKRSPDAQERVRGIRERMKMMAEMQNAGRKDEG